MGHCPNPPRRRDRCWTSSSVVLWSDFASFSWSIGPRTYATLPRNTLVHFISKGTRRDTRKTGAVRKFFRDKVISDIDFVLSLQNTADLWKKSISQSALREAALSLYS